MPTPSVILTASHALNLTFAFALSTSAVLTGLSPVLEPLERAGMRDVGVAAHGSAFLAGSNPASATRPQRADTEQAAELRKGAGVHGYDAGAIPGPGGPRPR